MDAFSYYYTFFCFLYLWFPKKWVKMKQMVDNCIAIVSNHLEILKTSPLPTEQSIEYIGHNA